MTRPKPRILFCDDEERVLNGLVRALRGKVDVVTANGPEEALAIVAEAEPFHVIVSDFRMPKMNGAELLAKMRELSPNSVRVLFTGQADLETVMEAVNRGHVFRVLLKPCDKQTLTGVLRAALEQHELLVAEKVLLRQTLRGSIAAMTEILGLTQPRVFGRAERLRRAVVQLATEWGHAPTWELEVAAMLGELGTVVLPPEVAKKLDEGTTLDATERAMAARVPAVTRELLARIPRLEGVQQIVAESHTLQNGDGKAEVSDDARLLACAREAVGLERVGRTVNDIVGLLADRPYVDTKMSEAWAAIHDHGSAPVEIAIRALRPGMTLAEDVSTRDGLLLVTCGHVVTDRVLERLRNMSHRVEGPLLVRLPAQDAAA